MPQTFVNTYSPLTPIGAAMQNMSLALSSGRTPIEQDAAEAKIAAALAGAEASRAQAKKYNSEAGINENVLHRRADDSIDQDVSFRLGVPLPRVKAVKSFLSGTGEMPADVTPDEVRRIGQVYFSHRGGFADRTYNPEGVEKGIEKGLETNAWIGALANPGTAATFGRAQAARKGEGEFTSPGSTGMTLNKFTGATDTTSPLAQAVIALNKGRTNQANAAAGASGALQRQRDLETRTGVRVGAPVLVNDEEVGPVYTAPSAAVGRAPAVKPVDHKAPNAKPRRPLTRDQNATLVAAIGSLTGTGDSPDDLDQQTRARITSRATQLATDPESDYHQDPAGAAEAAVQEIAPQGFEKRGTYGSRKFFPVGAPAAGGSAPAPGTPSASQQSQQPKVVGRPAGKSDDQLIQEANDAIKKGKDRGAVMKRLQDWGVKVQQGA